jgi:hypothetical protein
MSGVDRVALMRGRRGCWGRPAGVGGGRSLGAVPAFVVLAPIVCRGKGNDVHRIFFIFFS